MTENQIKQYFTQYAAPMANWAYQYVPNWEKCEQIVRSVFEDLNTTHQVDSNGEQHHLFETLRKRTIQACSSDVIVSEAPESLESFVLQQGILQGLEELDDRSKKIFTLTKIEGLSYNEAASYLGLSKDEIEMHTAEAIRQLTNILDTKGLL